MIKGIRSDQNIGREQQTINKRKCDRFIMGPNTIFRNEHTVMGIKHTSGNYSLKPQ